MASLTVAMAQMRSVAGDTGANAASVLSAAHRAAGAGADVLLTPEMALTGYAIGDLLGDRAFLRDAERRLLQLAAELPAGLTVLLGTPLTVEFVAEYEPSELAQSIDALDRRVHNSVVVLRDGAVRAIRSKSLLPTYSVFDDSRWVSPGSDRSVVDVNGVKVGIAVCEDLWKPEIAAAAHAAGADVLLVANASPYEYGKCNRRLRLIEQTSDANNMAVFYCNSVGGQDELVFDGGSVVIGPSPRAAVAPLFDESLLVATVDVSGGTPVVVSEPERSAPVAYDGAGSVQQQHWVKGEQQVWQALTTALRDYAGTCGFTDVLIGLSGGIDSAVSAAVAVDALGREHVHGYTMPGPYSSAGSVDDALELASRLGIECSVLPIKDTYEAELALLGGELSGPGSAVARENIQARLRALHLMTVSNARNWMVLNNGNKSEAAVGYFTLGGDGMGGFALLKDVYKTEVYALARWRNEHADYSGMHAPVPAATIDKPPSAELAPDQVDTDSLPPYPVLDAVLRAYLESADSAGEIADAVAAEFPDVADPAAVVLRVLGMVDRSEHKRRQVAPGPRVTPKSFGIDRRMPIAARRRHSAPDA